MVGNSPEHWVQLEQKADASNKTGARHLNLADVQTVRFQRDPMDTGKYRMAEVKLKEEKVAFVYEDEVADRFMRHWLDYLGDKLPAERIDPIGKAGTIYLPDRGVRGRQ